jgi:hypothetical protein
MDHRKTEQGSQEDITCLLHGRANISLLVLDVSNRVFMENLSLTWAFHTQLHCDLATALNGVTRKIYVGPPGVASGPRKASRHTARIDVSSVAPLDRLR